MKKRILCPNLPRKDASSPLSESESHHAIRVLRLKDGDQVLAMDGQGHQALAILRIRGGTPRLEYTPETLEDLSISLGDSSTPLVLEMAVLKGHAMEWVIEKAVELGVRFLIPILTAHTVVQMKLKTPEHFRERWQKIANQCLKQCGRLNPMEIQLPISLEGLLVQPQNPHLVRIWCDESSHSETPYLMDWLTHSPPANQIRILIGPEGGWSTSERSQLSSITAPPTLRMNLGPLILRAETAAIFSISLISATYRRRIKPF